MRWFTGMRRYLAGLAILLVCAVLLSTAMAQIARYLPGEHYQPLAEPVTHAGEAIPVIEFFLYSCPHCYALDDAVTTWQQSLPADVAFRRVPVLFGADGRFYARLFYTEKALGVLDRMHARVFDAIHQQGRPLNDLAAARAFFEAHGVDGETFVQVFNSPAIDRKVARAGELMRAFRVRAVPSLGVAGRYWVTGAMAGSNRAMFEVAEYLIAKTRNARSELP